MVSATPEMHPEKKTPTTRAGGFSRYKNVD